MEKRHGFTVIEVLIIVAAMVVVACIITPVLSEGESKSKAQLCMENLKQIGTAQAMYLHDYDNKYPIVTGNPGDGSFENVQFKLKAYLKDNWKQVLTCPSVPNWQWGFYKSGSPYCGFGYFYNREITQYGWIPSLVTKKGCLDQSEVKVPAETIAWLDAWGNPDNTTTGGDANGWSLALHTSTKIDATREPYKSSLERHDGKFNVLYFDGHAAATTVATCGGTEWTKLPWCAGSDRYPEK
jgi:prepilin-type processing-associated H-X9-DG protein